MNPVQARSCFRIRPTSTQFEFRVALSNAIPISLGLFSFWRHSAPLPLHATTTTQRSLLFFLSSHRIESGGKEEREGEREREREGEESGVSANKSHKNDAFIQLFSMAAV